jgi:hypothetical protein
MVMGLSCLFFRVISASADAAELEEHWWSVVGVHYSELPRASSIVGCAVNLQNWMTGSSSSI